MSYEIHIHIRNYVVVKFGINDQEVYLQVVLLTVASPYVAASHLDHTEKKPNWSIALMKDEEQSHTAAEQAQRKTLDERTGGEKSTR